MGETDSLVVSRVDFKCYGAYEQRSPALFPAQMILYNTGDHLTDCSSLGDRGICQFKKESLDGRPCPFLHDR